MNKKTLFLVITLTAMLILVTSVNAATDNTNTSTTHSISEKTTTAEPVVKEIQKQEKRPEKRATKNDKKIIKENKTNKNVKDSITIGRIEYTNIVENQTITESVTYTENTYINNSTFNSDAIPAITFTNSQQSIINCSDINSFLMVNDGELKIYNTNLNNGFFNYAGEVYIDDTVTIGADFYLYPYDFGAMYTNNTALIEKLEQNNIEYLPIPKYDLSGNLEINNENINTTLKIPNTGNITIINSNVIAKITNNGNLVRQAIVFSS